MRHLVRREDVKEFPWEARHVIGLTPTHGGTTAHGLATLLDGRVGRRVRPWLDDKIPSWREQLAGSQVLLDLQDPDRDVNDAHSTYTTIVTPGLTAAPCTTRSPSSHGR